MSSAPDIRPREVQNFLYAGSDTFGLTLSTSVAVNDYKDPTDNPVPNPVLQPILLASRRSCHGEGNWYLQEGDHHFRFSVTSHAAGWRNGYRAGIAANSPLIAAGTVDSKGRFVAVTGASNPEADLPETKSFLPFSAANLVLSAMKTAEALDHPTGGRESVILRVYDIEGRDVETALEIAGPVRRAVRTNIIEEEGEPLKTRAGRFVLPVGHHAVETVKLVPTWAGRRD